MILNKQISGHGLLFLHRINYTITIMYEMLLSIALNIPIIQVLLHSQTHNAILGTFILKSLHTSLHIQYRKT